MAAKTLRCLVLSLVALSMWSCGDDDDEGGVAVSSGLPNSQKLSELSTADAKRACTAYRDAVANAFSNSDLKRYTCVFAASIAIELQAQAQNTTFDVSKCEMFANECVKQADDAVDPEDVSEIDCENTASFATIRSCEATVGDFESCATFQVQSLSKLVKGAKCEPPDLDAASDMGDEEPEVPAQCDALYDKCGDIFRGMSNGGD